MRLVVQRTGFFDTRAIVMSSREEQDARKLAGTVCVLGHFASGIVCV